MCSCSPWLRGRNARRLRAAPHRHVIYTSSPSCPVDFHLHPSLSAALCGPLSSSLVRFSQQVNPVSQTCSELRTWREIGSPEGRMRLSTVWICSCVSQGAPCCKKYTEATNKHSSTSGVSACCWWCRASASGSEILVSVCDIKYTPRKLHKSPMALYTTYSLSCGLNVIWKGFLPCVFCSDVFFFLQLRSGSPSACGTVSHHGLPSSFSSLCTSHVLFN